jgi:hypothetical protein
VGCVEGEAIAGVVIESMHGEPNVLLGGGFERHLLRKELSDESVDILVGVAFPRDVGIGEMISCLTAT